VVSSDKIVLKGSYGEGEIQGSFNLLHHRGTIHVSSATLDWSSLPQLPDHWQPISLRGSINQSNLTLLQNHYTDLHGNYKLSQGIFTLKNWQATLADGALSGNQLDFTPLPDALKIHGNVHGQNIQLDQVQGLAAWMQADLSGSLQANIILDGRIAKTDISDWQHSNGDMLIYSGSWQQHALSKPSTASAFKKLEFRFRVHKDAINISDLTLIQHQQRYQGKLSINPMLHLSGTVQRQNAQNELEQDLLPHRFIVDSDLPQINWTAEQAQ